MGRRHRRSKVTRVVNLVKKIIAFFFSHIGLCALVVGYALLGAVIFKAVEGPHEAEIQELVKSAREKAVDVVWNATFRVNRLDSKQWKKTVLDEVKRFKTVCMLSIRKGYDGKEYGKQAQWTFTGAFLYSLTVITTIGYGNTAAKTYIGKTLTMLYAIIGIPLMLLFLTNIGDVMAKIFRFLYAQSIRLKFRLILWHKKRKAAKIRRANSLVSRLTRGHRVKADSSVDSFGLGAGADVEDLLTARVEMEQLEVRETAAAQLESMTVPISLVVFTMLGYLGVGTTIFKVWEGWTFLESFYFCFISLTTIGFGDKFPSTSVSNTDEAQEKLVITSIYLLFGMALLAMCFNLAQEEVQNKTRWIADKFRSKEDDDD
ncbi:Potassium channel domain-containing protein [Caenorhabditis elegans]|uniref:Potassium channel domain-containing protein n=1 Tax=Caenorhabditis elegans TaxID=6239 RepID=Q7YWY7_CAEEL|nr:Potassium channel domain-containing protein [Caenorhabditis elegans]CAE17863.1 Potassium channel domain-containing protein [Caenorhabditis elegans]|eukprot:NP_001022681.1 TWiK family of potassium channels [Caenorhabditis elegans]